MTRPLLGDVIPLDEVKLLDILRATGEISWVLSPAVCTFLGGGESDRLGQSFVACCWSHLTHLGGRPQNVDECPKDWQL